MPQVNAKIDGTDIVENLYYDISVAIGTDKGLMVPVLRDCDRKTLPELELELAALAEKSTKGRPFPCRTCREGASPYPTGARTVPALHPHPEPALKSGILGMHAIRNAPSSRRPNHHSTHDVPGLSPHDHRLVDGKQAVQFLIAVKNAVENPVFEL